MPTEEENSPTRLDRIERIVEGLAATRADMRPNIQILTTRQLVVNEGLDKLAAAMDKLAEAQRRSDENLSALRRRVDEIIPGRKPQ